jgi:hypothetical protein
MIYSPARWDETACFTIYRGISVGSNGLQRYFRKVKQLYNETEMGRYLLT